MKKCQYFCWQRENISPVFGRIILKYSMTPKYWSRWSFENSNDQFESKPQTICKRSFHSILFRFAQPIRKLKAFFHNKEDDSNTSDKEIFETLQTRKSKWTSPEGQFASLDFFVNKCRHDSNKLNFNRNTKFSNLSSEERAALKNLSKRKDIIVKAAGKGGALVVWRADLY